MAWERRRNQWYFYSARRVGGKIIKSYHGRGRNAELFAMVMDLGDQLFSNVSVHEDEAEDLYSENAALHSQVTQLVAATLEGAGLYQHHRGEWRRRRNAKKEQAVSANRE